MHHIFEPAVIVGEHLAKGSESEYEIRGCSIHAVEVTNTSTAVVITELYCYCIS